MKIKLIDKEGFINANRGDYSSYRLARVIVDYSVQRELNVIDYDGKTWVLDVYGPLWRAQISAEFQQYFETSR